MENFDPENELLPHIIDHYARITPEKVYAEYPRSPNTYKNGFLPVTYQSLSNSINGIAWWLTKSLGPGDGEALAYVGSNDVRYPALVFGAIKAGYCIFLISPRNSIGAYESLFKSVNCTKLLTQCPRLSAVSAILDGISMEAIEIPSLEELLSTEYPHFKYCKTYPEDRNDTMAIVHTSGSTGIPKPITWTLEIANKHIRMSNLQAPEGHGTLSELLKGSKMFLTLPPFHAAGIGILIFFAVPSSMTVVIPISGALPTAISFVEAAKQTDFNTAVLPPSIMHELAHNPELLDFCSQHMKLLLYGGGDLPQSIGNTVARRIKLANMYGASETGILSALFSDSNRDPFRDWKYIMFHPELGAEFRHVMDDKYELILIRSQERQRHQMPFGIFPRLKEYPTRDLFARHPDPSKSDLWSWCSRVDDVIVFLNGEKTNPVSMEQHITSSNSKVTGVIVAGAQRFQASLVIEYGDTALDPNERAKIIEELWPVIDEANSVCPAHARISRTHILFTTPEKPMLRAGKGTIQRTATLALYEPELDALYTDADALTAPPTGEVHGPGRVDDAQQISDFIRHVLISATGWGEDNLSNATNFFHLGLDSLQAITAARLLKRGLDLPSFTPNLIYLHPSIPPLTTATLRLMHSDQESQDLVKEEQLKERNKLLEAMIGHIDHHSAKTYMKSPQLHTVLLTGSTGTLGTYVLDVLLKDPSVGHIHCLNRRKGSRSVQHEKSTFYNLNTTFDSERVSFWHADLSQKNLGLDAETFIQLQGTVTAIFHNAWNVNFNLSLSSFKPELLSVVNLINFTASSETLPHLFFISSMSSILGHRTGSETMPEAVVTINRPSLNGYAGSKYIAEHIIDHAVKYSSIRASIVRVGQVAGAVNTPGLWNKSEWFPSLVISSREIGALPQNFGPTLGQIDWVPVDLLAGVLVDLALSEPSDAGSVEVFHPLNLHPKTWDDVAHVVSRELTSFTGKPLEIVTLSEWVQRVRKNMEAGGESGSSDENLRQKLEKNPAAKLLSFFEGIDSAAPSNTLDTQNTASMSHKLRAIDGVKAAWIRKWVGEWVV